MAQRIEDYALLGDLHTATLVGRDGSIDWLCLPRFDSAACFAALLGNEDAGRWLIAPVSGGTCTNRRYRPDTLVLETEWETPDGTVRVIDAMPPRGETQDLVRVVEGVSGRVTMRTDLRLRFDYGHVLPWIWQNDGRVSAVAGPDAIMLDTPIEVSTAGDTIAAEFDVAAGDRVPFVMNYRASHLPAADPRDAERALQETQDFWLGWIAGSTFEGELAPIVRRSLITLKALTYAPTGGIAAAATTSLPEDIGGERNWDYRFCWLRDSAFTLQSFISTGFISEAAAWRDWLLRAVAGDPADLQIMYSLDGVRRLPEATLDWLPGYEHSSPVRIGNAASEQLQIDVWGEVLDSLHLARTAGIPHESDAIEQEAWKVQKALLEFLEQHWNDPDDSLWEVRGHRRQFVHSKVLAWAGVDRAVRAVEDFGLDGPVERWRQLRDTIHAEVCESGYDPQRNTFTQFYGSTGLDAALLLIPQVGFLPWDDPRVVGTVNAIADELDEGGYIVRYRTDAAGGVDGLGGKDAPFLACSFWMVTALVGIGERDRAVALFDRLLALCNDVGLLSEEYDPDLARATGNTPQAFSHVGVVNAALALSGTAQVDRSGGGQPSRSAATGDSRAPRIHAMAT